MDGFDTAWLAAYNAKLTPYRDGVTAAAPLPDRIEFTIPKAFKTLNELLRMHWRTRTRYAGSLCSDVALTIPALLGRQPMYRARVTITRYGMKVPDRDNLYGGAKILADCLLPRSERHPHGLRLITDDNHFHLDLIVIGAAAEKRASVRTHVLIERLPDTP